MIGIYFRDRRDPCFIHDNRIALDMGMAVRIADGSRVEGLHGAASRYGTGHNPGAAAFSVKFHVHIGNRTLGIVCHQSFRHEQSGIFL